MAKSPVWKNRPIYRVTTDDGDEIFADQNHEWVVSKAKTRDIFHVKDTAYLSKPRNKRLMVRKQGALQLPDADLPIDPYVLGVWLGNGCSENCGITCNGLDTEWFKEELSRLGYETRDRSVENVFGVMGLGGKLRELGLLKNKHVPNQYLRASESQRFELLRGLCDTDGHVAPDGQVEFCSTDLALAEGCLELVRSLGTKASLILGRATLYGKDCGPKFRVMFYKAGACKSPRKSPRCRDGVKQPNRYIGATYVGTGDTVCIEVDSPSHMFLCGRSMIPTCNSTMTSMYFPAWYLGRNPDKKVILASYEAEFASEWGRKVRDLIEEDGEKYFGVKIRQDSKAADRWMLKGHSGGMQTVGMGGALLGKGAHLLVLDDVQKQEDAFSETLREKAWNWYVGTAYTRLEPGGSIVVVMQRWHEADMVGKILDRAKETGEEWVVYNLPALAEDNDPMGRKRGEALWPEHFNEEYLLRVKATQKHLFNSVYQQRPSPEGGGLFRRSDFKYYDRHENYIRLETRSFSLDHCRIFLAVDLAFSTRTSADYTCIGAWAVTPDSDLILLDMHREQMTGDKLVPSIRAMMDKHKASYCGIEDVAAQNLVIKAARKQGLTIQSLKTGNVDKIARSVDAQIRMEAGQIWFPKHHPELDNLETELMTFPNGAHDDTVDVLAYASLEVQKRGPAAIPPEERERMERERLERAWLEKIEKDRAAQQDWQDPRWWPDSWHDTDIEVA